MLNEFTYTGTWCLPENLQDQVPGTLIFDAKGDAELSLAGYFDAAHNVNRREENFIIGFTVCAKKITLYRSFEFQISNTNGIKSCKYSTHYVFIGTHFHSEEDLCFYKIEARFKNLDRWIKHYSFKIDANFEEEAVNVQYKNPKDISFTINDKLKGAFTFSYDFPWTERVIEALIRQKTFVEIVSNDETPFMEILKNLMLFQNFLTLGTYDSAYPTSITIYKKADESGRETFTQVIYKPGFSYSEPRNGREIFLFEYEDIKANFQDKIQKWYKLNDIIDPVTNILFDSFYSREKSTINQFLNITQALETFHRRLKNYKSFDEKEFTDWLSHLTLSVDIKYKELVEGRLKTGNEPHFGKRISDLVDSVPVSTLQSIIPKKKSLVYKTTSSRNYYTHYSNDLESQALKGNDLYKLTQQLRVLLIAVILLETGFSIEEIENVLKKNEAFLFRHLF
jgi:hypothetical protein